MVLKLNGTSIVKLSKFLENLKDIAGTCFITRNEYDQNPDKICSYSHINKIFKYTWNTSIEMSGLLPKRTIQKPFLQGRKLKDRSKEKEVSCLRCDSMFISPDPSNFRICNNCKNRIELEK